MTLFATHINPTVDAGIIFLSSVVSVTLILDLEPSVPLVITGATQAGVGTWTKAGKTGKAGKTANASAEGCVDLSSGFDVNAGAQGSFLGLSDESTQATLFTKDSELFLVCARARGCRCSGAVGSGG